MALSEQGDRILKRFNRHCYAYAYKGAIDDKIKFGHVVKNYHASYDALELYIEELERDRQTLKRKAEKDATSFK